MSTDTVHIAVIHYSATGTVSALADAVAAGARDAGADVRLLRVTETAPQAAVDANDAWAEHHRTWTSLPVATPDDVVWADGIVFGTPTRFGNVAAQLKGFLDTLGGAWSRGDLADRVYSGFTASQTRHGGQESTLLALYQSIHHFGGLIAAPGYTDDVKFVDGNPYGTGHVTNDGPVADTALAAARHQGRRVALLAAAVRSVRIAA